VHDLQRALSSDSPKPSWLYPNIKTSRQEKVLFIGSAGSDNSSIIKVGKCPNVSCRYAAADLMMLAANAAHPQ
jgi:hypothetical protein